MMVRLPAAMVILAAAGILSAQAPVPNLDAYENAVRTYASGGDLTAAVTPLQAFTSKDLNAAVVRLIRGKDRRLIEAASVFQLEVGIGVIGLEPAAASGHFRLGGMLLANLQPPPREQWGKVLEEFETLQATWYGVAGSAFLSVTDLPRAKPLIHRALSVRPNSAVLRTMEGAIHEIEAAASNPDFWPPGNRKTRMLMDRRRRLALAEHSFQAALRADPAYVLAEVRLGRVQFLREQYDSARAILEQAEPRAHEAATRHLAALFLGAAHQHLGNTAAASAAYERALTVVPTSQTAVVALSYIDSISGRPDRAQARVRAFAASTTSDDRFWWAYRNGGLDEAGLDWLRKRVQR